MKTDFQIGEMSICQQCGRAIVFKGEYWEHPAGKFRHSARPYESPTAPDELRFIQFNAHLHHIFLGEGIALSKPIFFTDPTPGKSQPAWVFFGRGMQDPEAQHFKLALCYQAEELPPLSPLAEAMHKIKPAFIEKEFDKKQLFLELSLIKNILEEELFRRDDFETLISFVEYHMAKGQAR